MGITGGNAPIDGSGINKLQGLLKKGVEGNLNLHGSSSDKGKALLNNPDTQGFARQYVAEHQFGTALDRAAGGTEFKH